MCVVDVNEKAHFDSIPLPEDLLNHLKIGSFDPNQHGLNESDSNNDVTICYSDKSEKNSASSVFKVTDNFGRERLLKNAISIVTIGSSAFSFRNPPHFNSLTDSEVREHYVCLTFQF